MSQKFDLGPSFHLMKCRNLNFKKNTIIRNTVLGGITEGIFTHRGRGLSPNPKGEVTIHGQGE